VKFAVTDTGAVMLTVHVPVPVQPPLHPVKSLFASGTAVSTTEPVTFTAHTVPHDKPPTFELTVPVPVPDLETVSGMAKFACTVFAAFMVRVHGKVPVHAPDQPKKTPPVAGDGVSMTVEALMKFAAQVPAQDAMPAGVEFTTPGPTTVTVTG
jgi:hypothetical protein